MEFESFDSLDAMYAAIAKQRKLADAWVQPFQREIGAGQHYKQRSPYDFSIYGVVLPDEKPRTPELQNYRFVKAYSVACPTGELGDIHVSDIERILSKDEFLEAQNRGWADEEIID